MLTLQLLFYAAILIFLVYNLAIIGNFGIPTSLSASFYLLNERKNNLGYIFTAMMWTITFLIMPYWMALADSFEGWEHYLVPLAFLAPACIAFVGTAPAFRGCELENRVHMISASLCAVFSILWCLIACWRIAYIVPISIAIVWLIAYIQAIYHVEKNHSTSDTFNEDIKQWLHRNKDYWWEMCAFLATFATLTVQGLI